MVVQYYQNCTDLITIRVRGQMIGGEVCITPNHLRTFPAPHFLQGEQRRPVLHVQTCPSVSQIMPAEVFDLRSLQCGIPRFGAHLSYRLASVAC